MARRALTGILLVGGASVRFGGSKGLASFRGETLAERGWRVLSEACDEVLAVGKGDERLPFPVVDDGTDERAPAYGVLAGLRAAAHGTIVVLPVDCPLVTAALLRALGEAGAVPRGVPLPGAYPRALLPALERRLAAGNLSLRGLNPVELDIEASLLADADTPEQLADLARADALR